MNEMELTQLINSINSIQVVGGELETKDVLGIFSDSRKVVKNSVFVAIKGYKQDGHKYILDAINNGAIAIIMEDNSAVPDEIFDHTHVTKILVQDSRIALAEISDYFYKYPSSKLKLIGITGTNGKTTTTYFLKNIFEEEKNKVGLIGTVANYIGNQKLDTSMTTPESSDLNNLLMNMVNEGCKYAVMEVSSHSLYLKRVYKLNFNQAIFTNLTSDHLDFHQTIENYLQAKKILFDSLNEDSIAIVNKDDRYYKEIVKDTKAKIFSYGQDKTSDFIISNINVSLSGTKFNIIYNNNSYEVSTSLIGEFNAYNAASAFASSLLLGFTPKTIINGIKNTPQVPGRFEVLNGKNKKVIIDYSHTSDSMEKALINIKKLIDEKTKVVTVFGCGGDRDRTKRPIMGKISVDYSEKVYITNDNQRTEDPNQIINDILRGIDKDNYEVIFDREEAIKKAILEADQNSVILIAGKGHEDYQIIGNNKIHFSDKEVALKYLD